MRLDYDEQDTERVRGAEQSSAGVPTQQLTSLPQANTTAIPANKRNTVVALILISIGILTFFARIVPGEIDVAPGIVLLTIASCFLFFSFWRRIYGLLIPGCILAGLSLGVTFASISNGVSVLWGLALGFLAILLVGRALFNVRTPWPIYPAIPLFAVGIIVAVTSVSSFFAGGLIWLPLLLIGAGLYLGWGRRP